MKEPKELTPAPRFGTTIFAQMLLSSLLASLKRLMILCAALSFALAASLASHTNSTASGKQPSFDQGFRAVSIGVEHMRITRGQKSDSEATGPWVVNVLRVDLKQADLRVVHALDEGVGLETTSSMAARYGAIAAVNAGFFRTAGTYRGEPSGTLLVNHRLLSEPLGRRASLGFIRQPGEPRVIFGHLRFSGYVESVLGRRLNINGLNRPRAMDEMILYTPDFHRTTLTMPDGAEVIVRRSKAVRVRNGEGSSMIPPDGYVLSASGSARDWMLANLREGSRVRVETRLIPLETRSGDLWERAAFVVGGGPQLTRNGRVAITSEEEGIAASFVTDRHPRTAIARTKEGRLLLVTVDGRQPGVSVGMSLHELATLLIEFGASDAINLDGGGSTTMVVGGKLVNGPSDQTGERPVSDAILILPRKLHRTNRRH